MKSSSESIGLEVSGVGGVSSETAEAILLLDLVVVLEEGSIASAAFLFLSWEEMVSTVKGCFDFVRRTGFQARTRGCGVGHEGR